MPKLTCPACGETLSLAALLEHDAARDVIAIALQMPAPLGKLLMQYVSLFKPAQRALSMDRLAKILGELLPMITDAQVSKKGRVYAAPQDYWVQGISNMVANRAALILPLGGHGYLISIIAGYSEKNEARAERQSEQGRKYGVVVSAANSAPITKAVEATGKAVMPEGTRSKLKPFLDKHQKALNTKTINPTKGIAE